MNREREKNIRYRVHYGVDSNAALQPEYIPVKPQRKEQQRTQKRQQHNQKLARKAEVSRYTAMAVLVVVVAAMGFFIVSRNAEIYSNNKQIRTLAKEKTNLEVMLNTVEKDLSAGSELNTYFDAAQNQLNLVYPDNDRIITAVCPGTQEEPQEQSDEAVNLYDTVLDWFSSLKRRIKSWA